MKREFLKGLELSDELIDKIMEEHGKSVEKYKKDANTITTLNETVNELRGQLGEANKQIEEFKDMDIDGIKRAADDWKEKAEKAEREAQAKIAEMEHDGLLREKLSGVKFTSEYAKKGVFDEIKAKGLKVENGRILGFEDAFSAIKEAQPSAFEPDNPPPKFAQSSQGAPTSADDALRAAMGLTTNKN